MKLEVFNKVDYPQDEPVLRLILQRSSSGLVELVAVDKFGEPINCGTLLQIRANHTNRASFLASSYINESIPVELSNENGEVRKLVVR